MDFIFLIEVAKGYEVESLLQVLKYPFSNPWILTYS